MVASLLLTAAFVSEIVSLFAPYWIYWDLGRPEAANDTAQYAGPAKQSYNVSENEQPHRGLWAQCGHSCVWAWEDGARLQTHLFVHISE